MRSASAIMFIIWYVNVDGKTDVPFFMDEVVDYLLDNVLDCLPLRHADINKMTLGTSRHLAICKGNKPLISITGHATFGATGHDIPRTTNVIPYTLRPDLHDIMPSQRHKIGNRGTPRDRPIISDKSVALRLQNRLPKATAGDAGNQTIETMANITTSAGKNRSGDAATARLLVHLQRFVFGDEGLTKKRFAAMGSYAFLSYGLVSNINYIGLLTMAWFTFVKSYGLSPLASGQWKRFLAVYGGFWMLGNALRPLRIAAAMAITPVFERLTGFLRARLQVPTPVAFASITFVVNMMAPWPILWLGLSIVHMITGVPIIPPGGFSFGGFKFGSGS